MKVIKYTPWQYNLLNPACKTIAVGTTKQYRLTEITKGTTDRRDGMLGVHFKDVWLEGVHYIDTFFEWNQLPAINIFCTSRLECDPSKLDIEYLSKYFITDTKKFRELLAPLILDAYSPDEVDEVEGIEHEVQYSDFGYIEGEHTQKSLMDLAIFTKGLQFKQDNEYRFAFYGVKGAMRQVHEARSLILNITSIREAINKIISPT